jgi:oligoendopeptidase F
MVKIRSEVAQSDRWNVESLYPNFEAWKKDFETFSGNQTPHWPQLLNYKGKLGESAETVKSALDLLFSLDRSLSTLMTYAHLRHDEDIVEDQYKSAYSQVMALVHDFQQEVSWFEPELLALPDSVIAAYLSSPVLAEYRFHLEKTLRIKAHMLSAEKEELMALAGQALSSSHLAFSAINDADFKFGKVADSQEKESELTHGSYGLYIRDQDRTLRKNAFLQMHKKFGEYENTLCELLNGKVQSHLFNMRARNYSSCVEAALFPKNIDPAVYHALVKAVKDNVGALHKYVELRKRLPGVDKLHLYDMYVPLTADVDIRMSYQEAEDIVIESVAPLGTEYQNTLRQGLKDQRWVDRYENKNKRSGAYSSGSYDSAPYILMNYKDVLKDVLTLAHEAGHSMHSLLSHRNQPYQYGDYPIFLAEVASTFNEELLMRQLLKRFPGKKERIFLLTQKIEDIRATLFRQTMFAEFELFIHATAEKNIPLTPKLLKDEFRRLNAQYFGDQVVIDPEADVEWARIPHFYYNFYVYQYATGISAALALADRVINGGDKEREEYLSFLKAGSSRYPIDILLMAGVDMRTPEPVNAAIAKFSDLVDQLNAELDKDK